MTTSELSVSTRMLQVITVALSMSLVVFIAFIGYDANQDRAADARDRALVACRAEQSSLYNDENWNTLARVLDAIVSDDEQQVNALVAQMRSIIPPAERVEANC